MHSRIHLALALSLASIPGAFSHYFFPYFIDNGNVTDYYEYVREDTQGYMPWKGNYESDDFRCNTDSFQYASQTDVYKAKAGDTIGFGTDFGAQIEHPGPMQVYLSKHAPGFRGTSEMTNRLLYGPAASYLSVYATSHPVHLVQSDQLHLLQDHLYQKLDRTVRMPKPKIHR